MMTRLRHYSSMKDSGVPWLGDVPKHWEVFPNRAIFNEVKECGYPEEQMLAVTISRGVILQQDLLEDGSQKDRSNLDKSTYKLVSPCDIAYNKMRAWQGAIGVSDYKGIVSPAYIVQRPCKKIDSRYVHYLLRTPAFTKEAERWSYGIASDMWSLRPEHFKMIYMCLPPLPEQTAIVRFLDYVDRRIRRYVKGKEKLIGLLKEQKQAVIHQAVTRGLDPDVRLKPSGVEWLGEVPAHWEMMPLKHWLQINKAVLPETTDPDFEFRYLDISSVGTGMLVAEPEKIRFGTAPSRARRIVRNGDIIVSTVRTYLKAVWFANGIKDGLVCSTGFAVLTPRQGTSPKFVSYLMQSNSFTDRVTANSIGVVYPAITESRLGSFHVAFPPLPEQTAIAEHLDKETAKIDAAIARARRGIELLREYRTRLIADVVTGKLDVREAAAGLPDESDESGPLNAIEDLADRVATPR
ncbi:hypothetical protein NKDENANG_01209 [Candidatus Entotheonellaceae bacterium PAL068K]